MFIKNLGIKEEILFYKVSTNDSSSITPTKLPSLVLLSVSGKVYSFGNNEHGQLGDGTNSIRDYEVDITDKFNLDKYDKIVNIFGGFDFFAALSLRGRVYFWGKNSFGQLGDGTTINRNHPVEITNNFKLLGRDKIVSLFLGPRNSSAISNEGQIYIWGEKNYQMSKLEKDFLTKLPINISDIFYPPGIVLDKIVYLLIKGNLWFSITNKGRVFVWGEFHAGQYPDPSSPYQRNVYNSIDITKIEPIELTKNFILNSADKIESVDNDGLQYIFLSAHKKMFYFPIDLLSPQKFDFLNYTNNQKIKSISLGKAHSCLLTENGNIFFWGDNGYLQFGDRDKKYAYERIFPADYTPNFKLLDEEKISLIYLWGNFSSFLTNQNRLFIVGVSFSMGFQELMNEMEALDDYGQGE